MPNDLKPCPFCGATDRRKDRYRHEKLVKKLEETDKFLKFKEEYLKSVAKQIRDE